MGSPVVIVPGLDNSGPQHWQTLWVPRLPAGSVRVEQADWQQPELEAWVRTLDAAIARCAAPPVLVAHSLGCSTVVHWAARMSRPVKAALLVAPPDLARPDVLDVLRPFAPVPARPLPFPSVLVASSDDPYASLSASRELARAWGSRFVDAGAVGHLNTASGLGDWPQGWALLQGLG
ncbi:alpha/beta hydrolase [Aggregicoccus sp. 17bor-14]|uniref:RBBP9/YdeN family alpha/beta hydrolase n=1 Tax=Myxococcaceae TaxID=31 RepID=UPI00129CBCCC|nr:MULTISPECIES: alpha/beta fold hydrolase [Myxococcaceae]MBF5041595.1 serine hydrolase family protein [Simulacricoccus sp. 17bor-14]MRI87380.1 alpha/beta hydrolase [Aggregicoccus sp. 17bor-14]